MSDAPDARSAIPDDPDVLLAQFGRALSEIAPENAREGVLAELAKIGPEVDLSHIDIWRFYRPSNRAELIVRWGDDVDDDVGPVWVDATVNERLAKALQVGGGTATVPRSWIDDHSEIDVAGEATQVIIALIDREDGALPDSTDTTILIGVPRRRASLTLLSAFVADAAVLLKQFNRRVRAQRRFAHLLRVERAVGSAAMMFADPSRGGDAEAAALEMVRAALDARALMLARWLGAREVEISAIAAPGIPAEAPTRFTIPDVPGLDVDAAIRRRFSERAVGEADGLVGLSMGPEAEAAFAELGERRSVAMVPAGRSGRVSLGAVRHADRPFESAELDTLTAFGAVIGHARDHGEAEDGLARRRAAGEFANRAAERLATVDLDSLHIVPEVLQAFADLAELDAIEVSWAEGCVLDDDLVSKREAGPTALRREFPMVNEGVQLGAITVTIPDDRRTRHGFRALATLLAQTEARLCRTRDAALADRAHASVFQAADMLARQGPEQLRDALDDAIAMVGSTLPIVGIVLRRCDGTRGEYPAIAGWLASPDAPPYPDVVGFGEWPSLDRARESGEPVAVGPGENGALPRLLFPVGVHDRVDHLLIAAIDETDPQPDVTRAVLARLANLLTHAGGRIEAERDAITAFDHSPVGIVLSDDRGRSLAANQALLDLAGVESTEAIIGKRFVDFLADPTGRVEWSDHDDVREARAVFARPDGSTWVGQLEIRRVDGSDPERWLCHLTDVTDRVRAEDKLRHAATHDALTGLPNRRALEAAVDEAVRAERGAALLLLDLDRFKNINDSLGHHLGDELLVTLADRLRLSVRPTDLVARLGGDEFGVLTQSGADAVDAGRTAERILGLLAEPVEIRGQRVYPSASIGISVARGGDFDRYLREADIAMYQAKAAGGARYALFDEELQRSVDDRHRVEIGLREALRQDRIIVHYQPEIDLETGAVLSAEALARWDHPTDGVVAAGSFVSIAEQAGLIHDIGERVLDLAVAEAASWPGGAGAPMLRVNLSADQLHRDDLVASITAALTRHGLPARRLCLEITESAAMRDVGRSERALHALRELGVELAIDDFGTGYSSLAYLKRFPFDVVKIDRSFVNDLETNPDDAAFVAAIVSLADSLGLTVVAEGIETPGQTAALLDLGCRRGQGFNIGRPAPADALRARIG